MKTLTLAKKPQWRLNGKKIKIAVVDDHILFREGLTSLLQMHREFDILFEASNGVELMQQMKHAVPDVILMDVEMPVMHGVEAMTLLKQDYPQVRVISLTDDEEFMMQMIKKGCHGFLLKTQSISVIMHAIVSVFKNRYIFHKNIPRPLLKKLVNGNIRQPLKAGGCNLSRREKEILKLICHEYSSKEISDRLCISTRTVEGHREKIIEKTGVKNTAGMVLYAVKHQLV